MKLVLPGLIYGNQSAFVPRYLITDNIIVAFELLHSMSKKCNEQKSFIALKLDMSKVYDCVEWVFITRVIECIGFPDYWSIAGGEEEDCCKQRPDLSRGFFIFDQTICTLQNQATLGFCISRDNHEQLIVVDR
ncbi:hypothetical protein TorRG33x02_231030 [Trema orientale]|uniref:Reverse transcriptase domain-containing protein n=1 Tax=Trema orientale TaxID=63057 RepID=A0A2P5E6H2_TREOI|nr:hypothetical protein TorRG33x02_231030 [Trema orientale]